MEINIEDEFKNDDFNNNNNNNNNNIVNTDENIPIDNSSDNKIEIIEDKNNINEEKISFNSHHHSHKNFIHQNFNHNCNNPNCPLNKKQSNFQQLKQHLLNLLKKGDDYINGYIDDSAFSFDKIISNSTFPLFLKQILHAKLILFWVFILNTKYLLDQIQTENFYLKTLIFLSFFSMIISIIIFYLHYIFLAKKILFIESDEEIEKYVSKFNPEIQRNKCEICKSIKLARSFHCVICNKCVKKFNFHSDWFNICIGSSNECFYFLALTMSVQFFIVSYLIFIFGFFEEIL